MNDLHLLVEQKLYARLVERCREGEALLSYNHNSSPLFHATLILAYLHQNELPNAKAAYARTPVQTKDSPSIKFAFSLLRRAWTRDYRGFYTVIAEVENGQVMLEDPLPAMVLDCKRIWQERTLALLGKAYESIPPEKAAEYLGITPEEVFTELEQAGWTYDAETTLLCRPAKPQTSVARGLERETDFADFTRLTQIAMGLKNR